MPNCLSTLVNKLCEDWEPTPRWTAPASFQCLSAYKFFAERFHVPFSVALVYFLLSLIQELPVVAVSAILSKKEYIGASPSQLVGYYALTFIPWNFKPLYGIISDCVPIFGYRRRSYLLIGCAGAGVVQYLMSLCSAYSSFLLLGVLLSTFLVFPEVAMDSRVVELGNDIPHSSSSSSSPSFTSSSSSSSSSSSPSTMLETPLLQPLPLPSPSFEKQRRLRQAQIQSACMFFRSTGSLVASALGIILFSSNLKPQRVLQVTAFVPATVMLLSFFMKEERVVFCLFSPSHSSLVSKTTDNSTSETVHIQIDNAVADDQQAPPSLLVLGLQTLVSLLPQLIFVFLYSATPTTNDIYPTFIMNHFSFQLWQLQLTSFLAQAAGLLGTLFYWRFLTSRSTASTFAGASLLSLVAASTQILVCTNGMERLKLSWHWFIPLDGAIIAFFDRIVLMPPLVLASQSCPKGLEGAMFALFSSVYSAGGLVSSAISLWLVNLLDISKTNWSNLWIMIVICRLSILLPLLVLPILWIPKKRHCMWKEETQLK